MGTTIRAGGDHQLYSSLYNITAGGCAASGSSKRIVAGRDDSHFCSNYGSTKCTFGLAYHSVNNDNMKIFMGWCSDASLKMCTWE